MKIRVVLGTMIMASVVLVGCSGGKTDTGHMMDGQHMFTVTVKKSGPPGGPVHFKAKKNEKVALTVHSDVADEIHLHGYDIGKEVAKGGTQTIQFKAKDTGSFEVELEKTKIVIGQVEVR